MPLEVTTQTSPLTEDLCSVYTVCKLWCSHQYKNWRMHIYSITLIAYCKACGKQLFLMSRVSWVTAMIMESQLPHRSSLVGKTVWWVHNPCKTPGGQTAITQSSPLWSVCKPSQKYRRKETHFIPGKECVQGTDWRFFLRESILKEKKKGGKLDSNIL